MANTPQAKKRIRRNEKRAEINGARMSRIRNFLKKLGLIPVGQIYVGELSADDPTYFSDNLQDLCDAKGYEFLQI